MRFSYFYLHGFFPERKNQIREAILRYPDTKNISVVGYSAGTGKELLVQDIIDTFPGEPDFKNILFVDIDNYSENYFSFFIKLVDATCSKFDSPIPDILHYPDTLRQFSEKDWTAFIKTVERFFDAVRKHNYRVVVLLNIFDEIRRMFIDKDPIYYNTLYELTHKQKITFITLSKRKIKYIEDYLLGGSNYLFNSTVEGSIINCGYISGEEIEAFLTRLEKQSLALSESIKSDLVYYAGNNPKLLIEMAACICDNLQKIQADDISFFKKKFEKFALENNKSLLKELDDLDEKSAYISLCLNKDKEEYRELADKFLDHRLIHENSNGAFRAYSNYFQDYLNKKDNKNGNLQQSVKAYEVYVSFTDGDDMIYKKLEKSLLAAAKIKDVPVVLKSRHTITMGNVMEQVFDMICTANRIYTVCSNEYFSARSSEIEKIKESETKCVQIRFRYCDLEMMGFGDVVSIPKSNMPFIDLSDSEQEKEISEIVSSIIEAAQSRQLHSS